MCAHAFGAWRAPIREMAKIAIDSSTEVCSAALLEDGEVIAERLNMVGSNHAALLAVYVHELQAEAAARGLKIDGIVLSEGPGSYTGLRISASLVKGLCYGLDVPLIAVPTLAVIARAAITDIARFQDSLSAKPSKSPKFEVLICPMIDARRMEVYCALYDTRLNELQPLQAKVIDADSFAEVLEKNIVCFCGNGAEKCKSVITHPNARWADGIVPTGAWTGRLAEDRIQMKVIEGKQIAYFEPNYLKEFIAAPSHIKGLSSPKRN